MLLTTLALQGCGKAKTPSPESDGHRPPTFIPLASEESDTAPKVMVREDFAPPSPDVQIWESVDELPKPIAIYQHVFWEPADSTSFRHLLVKSDLVESRSVLEIGTGSGLIALCCLEHGASHVVATDINPWAQKNALFNGRVMGAGDRLEVRLVSQKTPDAWSVIGEGERFDVIFSNPPWQAGKPIHVQDFAFYDPGFQLLNTFLDGLDEHLNPSGRAFLAYGCVDAVKQLKVQARARGLKLKIHDERILEELPNLFLPGMLIEVVVPE